MPSDYHDVNAAAAGTGGLGIQAIYGVDSRYDEADVSPCWQAVGRSTVPLVTASKVSGNVWASCGTLGDRYSCPGGIRFGSQQTCGFCSGTLIAPNKIATAGHCISSVSQCSNTRVVFGANNETMIAGTAIPADTIYNCTSVDNSVVANGGDWAVFTLDRDVPASVATPVTVGTQQMPIGTGLMMIGHPSGLPTKYADNASIDTITNGGTESLYYDTNLDAFGGNSGSGVFTTGFAEGSTMCYTAPVMVGILVRGRQDYESNGCPTEYPQSEAGESVSGALTLLPYVRARDQTDSSTLGDCGSSGQPSPPPTPRPASTVAVLFDVAAPLQTCSQTDDTARQAICDSIASRFPLTADACAVNCSEGGSRRVKRGRGGAGMATWKSRAQKQVAEASLQATTSPRLHAHPQEYNRTVSYAGQSIISCEVNGLGIAVLDDLQTHHDVMCGAHEAGHLDIRVESDAERAVVEAKVGGSQRCHVINEDLEAMTVAFEAELAQTRRAYRTRRQDNWPREDWFTTYHNYADIVQWYADLAQANPTTTRYVASIGQSFEGRAIPAIHVFGAQGPATKRKVFFQCQIHAREVRLI